MKAFMGEDFLLSNKTAVDLYFSYAKKMPIFDYHNHLSAQEIYEHARYENLTQVWLMGDHYKWRAMRALGIEEKYITGDASDYEKFEKWAYTVARVPGNSLYSWTHLELKRYFDISIPLNEDTANEIWNIGKEKLAQKGYDSCGLLSMQNVKELCTTNDPAEDLYWHKKIKEDVSIPFKVYPTFRPDTLLSIEKLNFKENVDVLGKAREVEIHNISDLKKALKKSILFFKENGCFLSDHGFESFLYARGTKAETAFKKAMNKEALTTEEIADYKGEMLRYLAKEYTENGFSMQLHLGALRNASTKLVDEVGKDMGADTVGEATNPFLLSAYLDDIQQTNALPNTILYCLNPTDNTMLSTLAATFAESGYKAKVQFGSAWWFLDHKRGIRNQIFELMETGLLAASVGMLTDSRSFTSFTRHEYYRRILCDTLGALVENGEYPDDTKCLGHMVEDICYYNAKSYFLGEGRESNAVI